MLQDYLQPAGGDILSWVLCSWHVLNSGFLISWESFRHLISWNILKMQIKMVFFFFYDKMLYISELFLHTCTCISMTWKHFFLGGLKAVVYILCLKLHTRPLLLVFLLQCMVFTFLFLFFFFAPQGTHLNDRVDAANKRAVKILRNQWNLSFYMLNKFCAPRCQIKIMFIKPVC